MEPPPKNCSPSSIPSCTDWPGLYMRRERADHTLQPTALINEAYLRLAHDDIDWQNRQHFIAVAATVMRRVLVDHARYHDAEMRGGDLQRVELDDVLAISRRALEGGPGGG